MIPNTPNAPITDAMVQGAQAPDSQQLAPNVQMPVAQPQNPPTPKPGSLFRQLLAGALEGMGAGLQGESLDEAQQRQAQTKLIQQQTANARQQAQFAAQTQPFDLENYKLRNQLINAQIQAIPYQRERDRASAALDLARGNQIADVIHSMPEQQQEAQLSKLDDFTQKALNAGGEFLQADTSRGFSPDQAGTYGAAQSLLHRMLNQDAAQDKAENEKGARNYQGKTSFQFLIGSYPSPNGRQFGVIAIPNRGNTSLDKPLTVTMDGKRFTFPAGTPRSTVIGSQWDAFLNSVAFDHAASQKKTADQIDAIRSQISTLLSQAATDPKAASKLTQLHAQYNALVGLPSNASLPDFASLVKSQPRRIPAGATVAKNPQTGQTIYSSDGGKSWIDAASGKQVQ